VELNLYTFIGLGTVVFKHRTNFYLSGAIWKHFDSNNLSKLHVYKFRETAHTISRWYCTFQNLLFSAKEGVKKKRKWKRPTAFIIWSSQPFNCIVAN
jgi:hypothetical protein